MKRFKKLAIYVLVGVLLSSSVMVSYKKAEVVQASATLTLGTGALLMLGILGAYGIVYKGAVDSATGEYIWKGDRGLYPHEVEQAEEWFSNMYDNAVRNWCAQNGKDPDDWNGDDDGDGDDMDEIIEQPPLWDKLVGSSVCQDREMMKRAIKLVGAFGVICADVSNKFKDSLIKEDVFQYENYYFNKFDLTEYGIPSLFSYARGLPNFNCNNSEWNRYYNNYYSQLAFTYDGKEVLAGLRVNKVSNKIVVFNSGGTPSLAALTDSGELNPLYDSHLQNNGYVYNNPSSNGGFFDLSRGYNLYLSPNTEIYVKDANTNEKVKLNDNNFIDYNNYSLSTNIAINDNNKITGPVIPNLYLPSTNKVQTLLDGLENSTGDDTGTQNAVDTFVDSLGQEETDTEPDTGGEGGTVTDPDTGGQGGTGGDTDDGEDTEENDMFLADLKNVFPFCIPFDLVDCFRLFNAEPETPRVEVPLHFGIVEKDYTFVIDLKDFDGVAEICRSMFLILYIVGLVMATRPLIRG